jgi:Linalool dehydratase/isomerase
MKWRSLIGLVASACIWLPLLRFFFEPTEQRVAMLAQHETRALSDAVQRRSDNDKMRQVNPEWDLMRRMYLALSFADLVLSEPSHAKQHLTQLDRIVDDLLESLRSEEPYVFLLPYARAKPWKHTGRSLFVDGEVALVLETRLLLGARPELEPLVALRINAVEDAMQASPSMSGESYPDEPWTFCNTTALAALRFHDARVGTDHTTLAQRWIAYAKAHLVEPTSGLLASRYRYDGTIDEGAEGSSIFMAAHNLLLWDEAFARAQYTRARELLVFEVLGFGLAREWPRGTQAHSDVDSGPIVPVLGASPGASGLALLGATAFGDTATARMLGRSLELAAVATKPRAGELQYAAAGPMGNAVVLHALTTGPLFGKVMATPRASAR